MKTLLFCLALFTLGSCYTIPGENVFFTSEDYQKWRMGKPEKKVEKMRTRATKFSKPHYTFYLKNGEKRVEKPANQLWGFKLNEGVIRKYKGRAFYVTHVDDATGIVDYETYHGIYIIRTYRYYSEGLDGPIMVK